MAVEMYESVHVCGLCRWLCRATVIERGDMWFRDDGALTRVFCEDSK